MRSIFILFLSGLPSFVFPQTTYDSHFRTRKDALDYRLESTISSRAPSQNSRPINLDIEFGVRSDCGRINIQGTLQSTLKKLLDRDFFAGVGQEILAASPLLLACYASPTWCSILKHSQLSAHLMTETKLNQCSLIDKYTDKRTEDFFRQRQQCLQERIGQNGGDIDAAIDQCSSQSNIPLKSIDGSRREVRDVSIIDQSAKWAGLNVEEYKSLLNTTKALVGNPIVSNAGIKMDFGQGNRPISPRHFLDQFKDRARNETCIKGLNQQYSVESIVAEIRNTFKTSQIEAANIWALRELPHTRSNILCERLVNALASSEFIDQTSQSIDVLELFEKNPNLPHNRLEDLRSRKADLIQSVSSIRAQVPYSQSTVLEEIERLGLQERNEVSQDLIQSNQNGWAHKQTQRLIWDCADGNACTDN